MIIGGGHNGLVAAAYLARGGLSVRVLERREILGGACVTEEVLLGYKISTASYSLLVDAGSASSANWICRDMAIASMRKIWCSSLPSPMDAT